MGLVYNDYLSSDKIYGCKNCKTHLSKHESLVSRVRPPFLPPPRPPNLTILPKLTNTSQQSFRGQVGKGYLFNNVVNYVPGEALERNMTTGKHVVRDITCRQCKTTVGWKYDKAYEASEKYKEGMFILEAELLCNVT